MATKNRTLKVVCYNMHGFNQGCPTIDELIHSHNPDIFLLQEHWLTPANLYKFDNHFVDYLAFGSSAMSSLVEAGMLTGRPYGGVMILVTKSLRKFMRSVACSDRYVIVKVGSYLLANVYLPCVGSADRQLLCEDILNEIWSWRVHFPYCYSRRL